MDGVRRTVEVRQAMATASSVARADRPVMRPISAHTSKANSGVRYVTGMDGVRRAMRPVPRPDAAAVATVPAMAARPVETPVWSLPSLRLPQINWKRPAMAFGLVAMAFVASALAVRLIATPSTTTARAAQETPAASPAQTATVTPQPTATPQSASLQQLLNDFAANYPNHFGIVVKDLTTGQTASVNGDRQIASASLYKLFVAEKIFQRIDLGQLKYTDAAGGGTGRTVDGCLTVMINISDNACGWALGGGILDWGAQNQALRAEGYQQTNLATPQQTSAADVARLFERLYNGQLLSTTSTQKFMSLLKDQRVNNRLPKGLPAGTIIAHKTGDLNDVVHDAGIVYGPKTNYLVVVTSGQWNAPGNAPALFIDLSAKLWNYFEN
jgi:beta-lactamase class A